MARLIERPTLGHALDRYAGRFEAPDRRAIASLWSQYCFGNLVVPFVAAGVMGGRTLPVALDSVGLVLEDGLPSGLSLSHAGRPTGSDDAFESFRPLIRDQVAPLVAQLADCSGASQRLFWSNSAVMLAWALTETPEAPPHPPAPLLRRLFDTPAWPGGRQNPLFGALQPPTGPFDQCRRRVCCVRYRLPGIPGCGALCPLSR